MLINYKILFAILNWSLLIYYYVKNLELKQFKCNLYLGINNVGGILPAFASTAADAIPVLEGPEQLNSSSTISNWSKISLPQLSAATISNLREIISATSSRDVENVSTHKAAAPDDSDEYDDNDDDYFRVFDLRQKQIEG